MYHAYKEINFKPATLQTIEAANEIIVEYQGQGFTLTLRQLYYQFVARDLISNTERSYKNLGKIVTNGRLAGLISWTAIEDRGRGVNGFYFLTDPAEVIRNLQYSINFNPWQDQDTYVECWIEKDALTNVIEDVCRSHDVPYMACKGYLSSSEAWRSGQRFQKAAEEGKNLVLLHLGDHDPSGLDMTRDNGERLEDFAGEESPLNASPSIWRRSSTTSHRPTRPSSPTAGSTATSTNTATPRGSSTLLNPA